MELSLTAMTVEDEDCCEEEHDDPAVDYFLQYTNELVYAYANNLDLCENVHDLFEDIYKICIDCNYIPTHVQLVELTTPVQQGVGIAKSTWDDWCFDCTAKIISGNRKNRHSILQSRFEHVIECAEREKMDVDTQSE